MNGKWAGESFKSTINYWWWSWWLYGIIVYGRLHSQQSIKASQRRGKVENTVEIVMYLMWFTLTIRKEGRESSCVFNSVVNEWQKCFTSRNHALNYCGLTMEMWIVYKPSILTGVNQLVIMKEEHVLRYEEKVRFEIRYTLHHNFSNNKIHV